ncbi:MAG: LysM peptidoglycan-binding domain-containing protein [Anaerolineae bacterium]|jgi:lysozyme|nr:LysM peptidoglycan-binding domain-containing protein [Anaerolineae bacterium]
MLKRVSLMVILLFIALFVVQSVSAQTTTTGERIHVVRQGDTLRTIADLYNTTWQAIAARNSLANANRIYVGQRLVIPAPNTNVNQTLRTYTVQPGDNLTAIANRYNTTVQALAVTNNLTTTSVLYAGQVLRLPAQGGVITPPAVVNPPAQVIVPRPVITVRTVVNGYYYVLPGDNLSSIARYFGVDMWTIARANNILNLNHIYAGLPLRIPGR